ncbi:hypothetical protein GX441_06500 [bacterium]|nr:hypothetical protein [bacterium]
MKRNLLLTLISMLVIVSLSCVSPFYGTARIEPGWHMNSGLALTTFIGGAVGEMPGYYIGGRGDFELMYGFNKNLQAHIRAGLGLGLTPQISGGVHPWPVSPLIDGGIGLQGSLPTKFLTPALRLEFLTRGPISPTLLLGIGKKEIVILGADITWIFYKLLLMEEGAVNGPNGFVVVHFSPAWNIALSCGIPSTKWDLQFPLVSLGLGYTIK